MVTMASFPNSPELLKGGIVLIDLDRGCDAAHDLCREQALKARRWWLTCWPNGESVDFVCGSIWIGRPKMIAQELQKLLAGFGNRVLVFAIKRVAGKSTPVTLRLRLDLCLFSMVLLLATIPSPRLVHSQVATDNVTEYPLPQQPWDIAVERADRIWFTLPDANRIGSIELPQFTYTTYLIPTPNSGIDQLLYADGSLWFAERKAAKIGRFGLDERRFSEYSPPTPTATVQRIALAPNGKLWFTGSNGPSVLDPVTGVITETNLDAQSWIPAVTPDGAVWVLDVYALARYAPQTGLREVVPFQDPGMGEPEAMTSDDSGHLWISLSQPGIYGIYTIATGATHWVNLYNSKDSYGDSLVYTKQTIGGPAVWLPSYLFSQIIRVDPVTLQPTNRLDLPNATSSKWSHPSSPRAQCGWLMPGAIRSGCGDHPTGMKFTGSICRWCKA
jgi:streptogramin lyase